MHSSEKKYILINIVMLFYSTLSIHRFITIRYIQRYFNDQVFLCTKLRDLRERMEERKKNKCIRKNRGSCVVPGKRFGR